MLDLRQAVIDSLDKMVADGKFQESIDKIVGKTMAEIISDQMSSYGDFGKQLKKSVAKALAIHGEIDLPSYNDMIVKVVVRQMENYTKATIQKQVAENLQRLLTPPPETITLNDLVEAYIQRLKDESRSGCVCYGERHAITLLTRETDYRFVYVCLDGEANKPENRCDIQIGLSDRQRLEGEAEEDKCYEMFSLRFSNSDVEKQMFAGPFYNFERLLFQMKAAKTKILFDRPIEKIETSYDVVEV